MCGIAGIIRSDGTPVSLPLLRAMADTLRHRGPDDAGYCVGGTLPSAGEFFDGVQRVAAAPPGSARGASLSVGLAHRRLSIIDLAGGRQPLCNEERDVWIAFNGEIYNFIPLRDELIAAGHRFATRSDTETIVHAYEEWGVECLARLNGMFAFAIWDAPRGRLFMARDRIGKKPLYYRAGEEFLFGSELKAILAAPGVTREVDRSALADYLKYLYVPDPKTIYRGIHKLPPAHYLLLEGGRVSVAPYWDVQFQPRSNAGEGELAEELLALLEQCTRERLVSEVPLGAFLSGGVDSSGIVALMARSQKKPPLTCCIGFDDPDHDESPYAKEVARLLKTDHREYFVREGFVDLIKRLPGFFDEPFADSSAVPTYSVCQMARRAVTVAISGDGGDESFGGYQKYLLDGYERLVGRLVPRPLLLALNALCLGNSQLARKGRTLTEAAAKDAARAYYETNSFVTDRELSLLLSPDVKRELAGYDPFGYTERFFNSPDTPDHLSRLLYTDLKSYLPGDILVKVDRMSMANSLEVRSPLLDYRVIEFAASLPSSLKIRGSDKKYLLKRAFGKVLPESIFQRPKHGFTVPLERWFRGELRDLGRKALLDSPALAEFLEPGAVRSVWDRHQSGEHNSGQLLWSLLMFALWHAKHEGVDHV